MASPLFSERHLSDVLSDKERGLSAEITALDEGRVLKTTPEALSDYLVEKYRVDPLELNESAIEVDYSDARVDVSHRFEYGGFDRGRPTYVTGTRITFYVPFTGDSELFRYAPSRVSLSPPRATIQANLLVFVYERPAQEASQIKREFEQDLQQVRNHIEWMSGDVLKFNSTLRQKASQGVDSRREKLHQDRGIVEDLGFPVRRRCGVPTTYVVPEVKRRVAPQLPPVSSEPYRPDPTLDDAEYENILSIIQNMTMVMERSPKAFMEMGEEDLRQHYLVQLNGQYEGQSTGETFNFEGKTDILIRSGGMNLFIAECKFWTGPKGLTAALDQLLGYASWRDTKTALLIFNRSTQMTTVLSRIPEVVTQHPNYKSDRSYDLETGFRYTFGHKDDPDRDLILTILVFDIPSDA